MDKNSWKPFVLSELKSGSQKPRSLDLREGLGDRMRTAAFAELQAVHAFGWASQQFQDAPPDLREEWAALVPVERRHFKMIVDRMAELSFSLSERTVSLRLWGSLKDCKTAKDFCIRICSAEEWGRTAALTLVEFLESRDQKTAEIFRTIAEEEKEHVAVASRYFGWTP